VDVGEGVGGEVVVGLGVGVDEGVTLGRSVGVWVLDGTGVAGVAEGAWAAGEAGPGPQLARLPAAKINVSSRRYAGRCMGDFPSEDDLEKATEKATYHVIVLAVSGGDDLFRVPTLPGDPG
jgi:hypothetical protein